MRIFISRAFAEQELTTKLKEILEEHEQIEEAYMALTSPDFEMEISDKVTAEIMKSDYLVAIITKKSKASTSVHQEFGFAQGVKTLKIPLIEKNAAEGFLLEGKDKFPFDRNNFEESCKKVLAYIIKNGPRPKFSEDEKIFVQKSAHFRYDIRNQLDNVLDSIVYRLRFVAEDNRDLLYSDKHEEKRKLFDEIFQFVDQQVENMEKFFLTMHLDNWSRFSEEFSEF